jgi:phage-related protein
MVSPYKNNIQNYRGDFDPNQDYKKFDFVYNPQNSSYYYATNDVPAGGSLESSGSGIAYYKLDLSLATLDFEGKRIGGVNFPESSNIPYDPQGLRSAFIDESLNISVEDYNQLPDQTETRAGPGSKWYITLGKDFFSPINISQLWIKDYFFFDADYGARVRFKANNNQVNFGNGYYSTQLEDINAFTCEFDLTFKNRTNKEANAIMHFLENHPGSQSSSPESMSLTYSQGIKGFYWGGDAIFHPYDSAEMQIKEFHCDKFSHQLEFENNNNLSVTLKNYTTSMLNKSESLYVKRAENYNSNIMYNRNDVVFMPQNQSYYYCMKSSGLNAFPIMVRNQWSRQGGSYIDVNKDIWARHFFWKPSIGLTISSNIKNYKINVGNSYTQIYKGGLNDNLLEFDLEFNNRDDKEAYAILHFLESNYGNRPFQYTLPAPYNEERTFICEEWEHVYNYRNNHSVKTRFKECPIKITPDILDSEKDKSPTVLGDPVLAIFRNTTLRNNESISEFKYYENLRHRVKIRNSGGKDLNISSMDFFAPENNGIVLSLAGQNGSASCIAKPSDLNYSVYLGRKNLPFNLSFKTVELGRSFTNGVDGGYSFLHNGVQFFQKNDGSIINRDTGEIETNVDYFIVESFFNANKTSVIKAGKSSYFDVIFRGVSRDLLAGNLLGEDEAGLYNIEANLMNKNGSYGNRYLEAFSASVYFYSTLKIISNSYYNNGVDEVNFKILVDT